MSFPIPLAMSEGLLTEPVLSLSKGPVRLDRETFGEREKSS